MVKLHRCLAAPTPLGPCHPSNMSCAYDGLLQLLLNRKSFPMCIGINLKSSPALHVPAHAGKAQAKGAHSRRLATAVLSGAALAKPEAAQRITQRASGGAGEMPPRQGPGTPTPRKYGKYGDGDRILPALACCVERLAISASPVDRPGKSRGVLSLLYRPGMPATGAGGSSAVAGSFDNANVNPFP